MSEFTELRKKLIEKDFANMNPEQREAVLCVNGPLLVLAGAGTGKTTVLVNRVANLIKYGNAYHSDYTARPVTEADTRLLRDFLKSGGEIPFDLEPLLSVDAPAPWQILAITFTNKAADELKSRLCAMLGSSGEDVWASTFHSACVRILRRDGESTGYSKHFTIYDTDDSKRVMKDCQQLLRIDDKKYPVKTLLNEISKAKDNLISPEEYSETAGSDPLKITVAKAYTKYEEKLKASDAMDFDDIIVNTVKLLSENSEVRAYYQRRFRYVMVDEYQDTNHAQYILTALLSEGCGNLCVVGDDDQSIYKFRGATIENILSFENRFKSAKTIRLEQNYRSTGNILDAANAVIGNNKERKGKSLWTECDGGEKITLTLTEDERDEARYIANEILNRVAAGDSFSDFAVLYRTNAQSNSIERLFVYEGIPYRVIGGHRFYERKEIKDALAYLAVIANPSDAVRMRRIINEPKRGIGTTTVDSVVGIADTLGISIYEVTSCAGDYPMLSRSAQKLMAFTQLIDKLRAASEEKQPADFFNYLMAETGYLASLSLDKETEEDRKANLMELLGNLVKFYEENEEPSLTAFLEEIALMTDIDNYNTEAKTAVMMTLHSAKGLEFPCVFIAGMEEGLFPGAQVAYFPDELEEERRLAYVGITRAKKKLYITNARSRMIYGSTSFTKPSRFIGEIPTEYTDGNLFDAQQSFVSGFGFSGGGGHGYSSGKSRFSKPSAGESSTVSYSAPRHPAPEPKKPVDRGFGAAAPKEKPASASGREYKVGDTISHKVFGEGMILSVTKMGNDAMLEVAFEIGTKKLMANYLK